MGENESLLKNKMLLLAFFRMDKPFKTKTAICVATLAFVAAGMVTALQYRDEKMSDIYSSRNKFQEMKSVIASASRSKSQLEEFLKSQNLQIAGVKDSEAVNRDLSNLVSVNNLDLTGIKPPTISTITNSKAPQSSPGPNQQPATQNQVSAAEPSKGSQPQQQSQPPQKLIMGEITVRGPYENLLKFINSVDETFPWMVAVTNLEVTGQKDGTVLAKIIYRVYTR